MFNRNTACFPQPSPVSIPNHQYLQNWTCIFTEAACMFNCMWTACRGAELELQVSNTKDWDSCTDYTAQKEMATQRIATQVIALTESAHQRTYTGTPMVPCRCFNFKAYGNTLIQHASNSETIAVCTHERFIPESMSSLTTMHSTASIHM